MFKYINAKAFLISLFIGLFAVYITMPDLRIIRVYPTPDNAQIIQYKDKANNCFSIKEREVECPSNIEEISKIPVQS